ncbi:MAG: murein biosynthesis integral membrane protein MurJ [Spirochaetes bacterium RBG_16_49_21]|nr:MAG: murein biosynthesis integral membrane protein MurJ [Spirochaetes bacterium RBG_16_49_21]
MRRIIRSTGIVAASTIASRILGLARDMLMASLFSATAATDAFYAAFRIPNLFRRLVSEGVLTISFIPVYMEYLANTERKRALDLAQKILTLLLVSAAVLVAACMIFAPEVVRIIVRGFDDPSQVRLTVVMMRIMLPYLLMLAALAFCMGVLNSHNYFFAPAFALALLNVGIIAGILFFSRFFPEPLYGVCAGVLFGGLLQILLQIPYMARSGFKVRMSIDLKHPGLRRVIKLAIPGAFSMGIQQINILIATMLGSYLAPGSISYIFFSDRLSELVMGIVAVSIGNAVLPEMSSLSVERNYRKLADICLFSIRSVLFIAVPAALALMIIGFPIISVLLMHNRFTAFDAEMTYRALLYGSMGIASFAVNRITVPALYALHDPRTPFYAACASLIINPVCGWFLMRSSLEHAGLTLSISIASTVQMMVLIWALRKKIGAAAFREIGRPVLKYIMAGCVMGAVIWYLAGSIDWKTAAFMKRLAYLAAAVASGAIAYLAACYAMGVGEVRYFIGRIIKRN